VLVSLQYLIRSHVTHPYFHNQDGHDLVRSLESLACLTLQARSTFVNSEEDAKLAIVRVIFDLAKCKLGLHVVDPLPPLVLLDPTDQNWLLN